MEFKFARMHKRERDYLVGSDEYDLTPMKNGLVPILNPDMVIARKRAREWLAKQPDAELIYFSFDSTLSMYIERDYQRRFPIGSESSLTDDECDALDDLTQRSNGIREDWERKIDEEFLKVSKEESNAMMAKIVRVCNV